VDASSPLGEVRRRAVENVEEAYLNELLADQDGKIRDAAEVAGVTTRQLHKLMAKYGLQKEAFKVSHPKKP
jgi:DNA-binding NtrC family response regulator